MLHEGDILKDRYKVQHLIGKGGMSRVYMGLDLKLQNKLWAIKEVSKKATDQAGRPIEQSLAMEAELLSKLDHPMIVDIVDIITTNECIYVVMDYVEGKSLDKVIREEGPQSEEDVQDWSLQICDALDYLHNQDPPIIYRDMKPSNIMLRPDGYVKLIDLGVAREYKDQQKKDTISFGTEGYAPPEQYGKAQTDARSDVYALGATMWHLLSGESPSEYPLPDVRTRNENVGEGFAKVIVPKCTMLDKELRYQNCDELINDLEVYEELTQEYFDEQRNKVRKFGLTVIAGLCMLILSLVLFLVGNVVVTANYDAQVDIANHSSLPEETERACLDAIGYKPGEKEPYLILLDCYENKMSPGSETGVPTLTLEKYGIVSELIDKNSSSLRGSGQYAELCFQFGKAIWDYYDDGSRDLTELNRDNAISKAKVYFQSAKESTDNQQIINSCDMYLNIANAIEQLTDLRENYDSTQGATAKQVLNDYIDALERLLEEASTSPNNKVKLNTYILIQAGINQNYKYLQAAGISKDRVVKLLDGVDNGLTSLDFTTPAYNEAVKKCKESVDIARGRVSTAYGSTVAGK